MQQPNLADALFKPRRIALVGASANVAKATSRAQRYLLQHGYGGEIYPINPNRDEILGLTTYPSLSDAPQPIDHAFIMLGQEAVFQAVRDCVALDIPCATILAGGFAESGQAGRERQTKLLKIARAGGLRILGPNSIGMINVSDKTTLSANAMLDLPDLARCLRRLRYNPVSRGPDADRIARREQPRGATPPRGLASRACSACGGAPHRLPVPPFPRRAAGAARRRADRDRARFRRDRQADSHARPVRLGFRAAARQA